jgi:enediyne biosynthesis protein E7
VSSAAAVPFPRVPVVSDPFELAGIRRDPVVFACSIFARHGDRVRYEYEGWKTLVSRHPADLEHVARERKDNYVKAGTPDLLTLVPLLGDGLMTADRENWSHQRETVRPAFARQVLNDTVPAMYRRVEAWLDRLAPLAGTGRAFDLSEELRLLSLEVVADCLLGVDLGDRAGQFAQLFAEMSGALSEYRPGGDAALGRFTRARATLDGLTLQLLASRRDGAGGLLALFDAEHANDRLSMRRMRDQTLTMLIGGGETTSMAVGWTIHLLERHPEILQRVRDEAATLPPAPVAADLDALDITRRAVEEAMRLFPPVWMLSRIAREDDVLGEEPVAAGDLVVISLFDMHRHPAYWSDPERFDPDRFLPQAVAARPPFAYRPFSVGPRTCIGMGFAHLESLLVVAAACRRFRFRSVPGHPVEPEGTVVTLRPRHGLLVTVESLP